MSITVSAVEKIDNYVTDNANVFDTDTKLQLENALKELETSSDGIQIIVFTEKNIPNGSSLEERSLAIASDNGIGAREIDNGLLFYLAVDDRQFRWEVGYGLEPQLNSAKLGRISREFMVPKFQEGNYQDGIISGLAQVEEILIGNQTSNTHASNTNISGYNVFIGTIIVFLLLLASNPLSILIVVFIIYIIKLILRKKGVIKNDSHFTNAASNLFNNRGRGGFLGGGSFGGGFSGGGGHFGGGGFSGKF